MTALVLYRSLWPTFLVPKPQSQRVLAQVAGLTFIGAINPFACRGSCTVVVVVSRRILTYTVSCIACPIALSPYHPTATTLLAPFPRSLSLNPAHLLIHIHSFALHLSSHTSSRTTTAHNTHSFSARVNLRTSCFAWSAVTFLTLA